jgi:glutathione S-transferase
VLTVYGYPKTRSTRITWLLEELAEPYDFHLVDFNKGQHRSPEYLAINPSGKVPALQDGDFLLAESGAIVTYLADKYQSVGLIPKAGSTQRALHDQWSFFALTELEQPLWLMGKHRFALPAEYRVSGVVPTAAWELQQALALLSDELADKEYILGDAFQVVDILLGHTLIWADHFHQPIAQANLQAYLNRVQQRPTLAKAVAKETATLNDNKS